MILMEIGKSYERKNFEYKVVAKVPHESKEGKFAYMIAVREYGSETITYNTQEHEFGIAYKESYWIGV
jgi:hypothetical protein